MRPRTPERLGRERPRRLLALRLSLAALTAVLFVAVTGTERPGEGQESVSVLNAGGTLEHSNSLDGSAVLTASNIWPGWSGEGDVTIANTGTSGSWLRLTAASVHDVPGPAGGQLSGRLALLVEDVSVPGFPVPVYSGALGSVGHRWLGRMEPGEERTYHFRTNLPAGAGDNAYQASAVDVRFDWAVSDIDPTPPPPIDPPPVDPPPVDPPPPPPVKPPVPPGKPPVVKPPPQVVPDGPPVIVVKRRRLSVRLAIPATQRPLRSGRLRVLAACSRSCRAVFRGSLSAGGSVSQRRLGRVSRAMSAGIQTRVALPLRRRTLREVRAALRAGRPARGRVQIVARDASGRTTRAVQRIRFVPVAR